MVYFILKILLFVSTFRFSPHQVRLQATVSELKSQLELRTGILAELQSLYFNNVKLEDGQSLSEKNIKNGSVLRVKIKERSLQQIYLAASQGMVWDPMLRFFT